VIALDRDPNVQARADILTRDFDDRFHLIETPFSKMDALDIGGVDAVVLDIGVSSMQLDQAERGFSFMRSGPLDMRMGAAGPSAADAVNYLSHQDLIRVFTIYGEERRARRVADFIVRAREDSHIVTTDGLAALVEKALGRPKGRAGKIHPATRVFQALRIFVNDELGELYRGLSAAETILRPGGRLIVVTFHSLEDRIVKSFLRRRCEAPAGGSRHLPLAQADDFCPSFTQSNRSTIKPSEDEIRDNPRSRSAKLRVAMRTDHPAFAANDDVLPSVPSVHDMRWAA